MAARGGRTGRVRMVAGVLGALLAVSCRRAGPEPVAPKAAEVGPESATVTVAAAAAWIVPGQPFVLGLDLAAPPGWHTYWENPGDTGVAPEFRWRLPDGIRLTGVSYPVPSRFEEHGIVSLGYEGGVRLLADFETDAALAAGTARVDVAVSWMICKEVCVPVDSSVSIALAVNPAVPPAAVPGEAAAFARWRQRLPQAAEGWNVAAVRTPKGFRVRVEPAPEALGSGPARWVDAGLYPRRRGAFDLGAPPAWRKDGAAYVADIVAGAAAYEAGDRLEAILVVETDEGPRGWKLETGVTAAP